MTLSKNQYMGLLAEIQQQQQLEDMKAPQLVKNPEIIDTTKGTIDLRKSPDYNLYKVIFNHVDDSKEVEAFNKKCIELSELGWEPMSAPTPMSAGTSGYIKMFQQWVLKPKQELNNDSGKENIHTSDQR